MNGKLFEDRVVERFADDKYVGGGLVPRVKDDLAVVAAVEVDIRVSLDRPVEKLQLDVKTRIDVRLFCRRIGEILRAENVQLAEVDRVDGDTRER